MDQSIVTRKIALKKDLGTKAPRVNDYALQPGGALYGQKKITSHTGQVK